MFISKEVFLTSHIDSIFDIKVYSHFFKITRVQASGRRLVQEFLSKFIHRGFKPNSNNRFSNQNNNDKLYAFHTANLLEYRFHIGQYDIFKRFIKMNGYDESFYTVEEYLIHPAVCISTKVRDGWELWDKQPQVVDFVLKPIGGDNHSRLVTLPTGSGKTVCALWSICQRSLRTAIIILPSYIDKWCKDIQYITDASNNDIMVVQGSDSMRGLIELGKTKRYHSPFVIISMTTLNMFIKAYGESPSDCIENYGCSPEELYELLGIGTVLIDEIHQHLNAVYRSFCFMNVDMAIGLSGTFQSSDPFIDKIQRVMFPKEIRFEHVKMKKYIRAYGISYVITPESMKKIRTTERGGTTYSQTAFEKSILKNPVIKSRYLKLIEEVVKNGFMDLYQPGHKAIIFCRMQNMCEAVVEHLKSVYPDLDIRRYTQEDPFENVIEPDIRVTTHQSAGTAIDIPGLMTNITCDNIRSQVANLQCLGRLREPKTGVARYFSIYSESIKKHVQYQIERRELFKDRVVSFKEFRSNVHL